MKVEAFECLASGLKDVIAPARCIGCLKEGTWWCKNCRQGFVYSPLSCVVCKKERSRGITCTGCKSKTTLAGLVTAGCYSSPVFRRGVHWLKFKGVLDVAETMANILIPRLVLINTLKELQKQAVLVPIPLHKHKLRARGFNQSEKLAEIIGENTGVPVIEAVERIKPTWTQTKLPAGLRKENLIDSFAVKEALPADRKYCLLVDDVVTTGSTISEAARVLAADKNKIIWGVAVARG